MGLTIICQIPLNPHYISLLKILFKVMSMTLFTALVHYIQFSCISVPLLSNQSHFCKKKKNWVTLITSLLKELVTKFKISLTPQTHSKWTGKFSKQGGQQNPTYFLKSVWYKLQWNHLNIQGWFSHIRTLYCGTMWWLWISKYTTKWYTIYMS